MKFLDKPIIVIGRGHSGTRAIAKTLVDSGVFMGNPLNESYDLIPPQAVYRVCRMFGKWVEFAGNCRWDFSKTGDVPDEAVELIKEYLCSLLRSDAKYVGWKLPETTLILPWITRLFPDATYIYWARDPRDVVAGGHITDDLSRFNVPWPRAKDKYEARAISWKYQAEIVKHTPKPKNWMTVRFEDFVLGQEETIGRLRAFLGIPIVRIPVKTQAVGRWKALGKQCWFDFLNEDLERFGYEPQYHREVL